MTAKLYTTVVEFTVVVEASNRLEADGIIQTLIDDLGSHRSTPGVLGWDDVNWQTPDHLCPDCGGIGIDDDGACPLTPMLCTSCCDHEHGMVVAGVSYDR